MLDDYVSCLVYRRNAIWRNQGSGAHLFDDHWTGERRCGGKRLATVNVRVDPAAARAKVHRAHADHRRMADLLGSAKRLVRIQLLPKEASLEFAQAQEALRCLRLGRGQVRGQVHRLDTSVSFPAVDLLDAFRAVGRQDFYVARAVLAFLP